MRAVYQLRGDPVVNADEIMILHWFLSFRGVELRMLVEVVPEDRLRLMQSMMLTEQILIGFVIRINMRHVAQQSLLGDVTQT